MIKINLVVRKKFGAGAGTKASGTSLFDTLLDTAKGKVEADNAREIFRSPQFKKVLVCVVVGVGVMFGLDEYKSGVLKELDPLLAQASSEKMKLEAGVAKTKGYKQVKEQLDADEFVLRKKIEVIDKLLLDRTTPPKLLLSMSHSIPEDVWMNNFVINANNVTIDGFAAGFNQISDFMKALSENAYFTDLQLQSTEQVKDDIGDNVAKFVLQAKRR
jgi:Tfp pilus assembly protein PilN